MSQGESNKPNLSLTQSSLPAQVRREGFTASGINDALTMAIGHVRLGDLLKASGIISYEFLKEALSNFEEKGMPLGKILTTSGYLTEDQLRIALDIQALINNRQLPFNMGVRVLATAYSDGLELSEAFTKASVVQPEDLLSNKLGQILTQAGLVSQEDLDEALTVNQRTGLPLGHIFCYRTLLSQQLLDAALLGQQLVRRGSLSRESCIKALVAAREQEAKLLQLPTNLGYKSTMRRGTPRLGELLFAAGMIDDMGLISALQLALTKAMPCGQAFCEITGIGPHLITRSVEMQEMIDNETLTMELARDVYMRIRELEQGFVQALSESCAQAASGNPARLMCQLLKDSGRLKLANDEISKDIKERLEVNYNQSSSVARILIDNKLCEEHAVYNALRLSCLMLQQAIPYERAIVALDGAVSEKIGADEALIRLGALHRTRLKYQ